MSDVIISSINYNSAGYDATGGESLTIQNISNAPVDLIRYVLQGVASGDTHRYVFPECNVAAGGKVMVWTKMGSDDPTAGQLYMGRSMAVWNSPGEIASLLNAAGVEVSRYADGVLPPGAAPISVVIPAFWTLDPQYDQYWQGVKDAANVTSAVVIDGSWPATAAADPNWKSNAQALLGSLPSTVLGCVSTRTAQGDLQPDVVAAAVDAWYTTFGSGLIDGIYFDELFLPDHAGDVDAGLAIVKSFKQQAGHTGAKAMVVAGRSNDEKVVDAAIDWAVLWEDTESNYMEEFSALIDPQVVPTWWKNPAYRSKIVHVVHDCAEPARQQVIGWANERNAGNVYVMDHGLTDPNDPKSPVLYDHLPPYWNWEVMEVGSYLDFGMDPYRTFVAAARYAREHGYLHGWPNGEQAWYPGGHVHGTFLLSGNATCGQTAVAIKDLPNGADVQIYDIPTLWQACHLWATAQGYAAGMPTFSTSTAANGDPTIRIVWFESSPWLSADTVNLNDTYEKPSFTEALAVMRNVNRVVQPLYRGAIPTFVPDAGANYSGRNNVFNVTAFTNDAPITWADVLTSDYINEL